MLQLVLRAFPYSRMRARARHECDIPRYNGISSFLCPRHCQETSQTHLYVDRHCSFRRKRMVPSGCNHTRPTRPHTTPIYETTIYSIKFYLINNKSKILLVVIFVSVVVLLPCLRFKNIYIKYLGGTDHVFPSVSGF